VERVEERVDDRHHLRRIDVPQDDGHDAELRI